MINLFLGPRYYQVLTKTENIALKHDFITFLWVYISLPPKTESLQIKILIFLIFLLKT